jgi:uncharacterized protein (TIGR02996 family)
MDELIPFLRTIAANPDDDAPRLVFSDWLDEHEHHEYAEFIRLQIELARMDPSDDGYPEKTAKMRRCGVFTRSGRFPFFDYLPTNKFRIGFHRGFIASINTVSAKKIDTSGFDLIPLQTLRTNSKLIKQFKGFTKLKWLECYGREACPAQLLKIFGLNGWFQNLEELSLPDLNKACLEAGVIPQFDLPKLRNFFLSTDAFYDLGVPISSDSDQDDDDEDDDEYDSEPRPWVGLPDYLPQNALPNPKTPLERFIWHSEDDCDFFNDAEDWYWRGPTMESLLEHLKLHNLKQIEVVVDYDDHENGSEGVIAAPYRRNPLELAPTLERVTLDAIDLRLLEGSPQQLKALRIYGDSVYGGDFSDDFSEDLFNLLQQPVCSELESLHVEARGWWQTELAVGPGLNFSKLKSLHLMGPPLELFSNCQFPDLISLSCDELKTILERKWSKLQCLNLSFDSISDLRTFVQSDCCPNLTTLTISCNFWAHETDFSFLAECPHMPFLSLIQIPDVRDRTYIVEEGKLVPVRSDVMMDEQKPTTLYNISVVF